MTARKAARSGVVWGYVFGIYVASSALGFAATYRTQAERARFAALFGSNVAINALIGPAHDVATVAGFTVWRCVGVLGVVGAVWGLLVGTRLVRGEEDAGRWEILLAGQTTRRRATAQAAGGLAGGLVALWVPCAVITVVVGQSSKVRIGVGEALFFSTSVVASAAVFLAAGVLTSQMAATRRQAAGFAAVALGASYALRMVADSGTGLTWLSWLTPLGWMESLRPVIAPRPVILVPLAALTVVLAGAGVYLSGVRDLGGSIVSANDRAIRSSRLLSAPSGLALRLTRAGTAAWCGGVAGGALLMGFISKSAGTSIKGNATLEKVLARLGEHGAGAASYLGVAFLLVAVMASFLGASLIGSTRSEEAEGRLDHLLVRAVSRTGWLAGRLGLTLAAVVVCGLMGGVFAWFGAASQSSGIGWTTLIRAGLNAVPPVVCILGAGALAFGARPRATSAVMYLFISWGLLVEIVGGAINLDHWLLDTSVFHQMAAAPAAQPDWVSAGVLAALGVAAAGLGVLCFARRDLAGE